LGIGDWGLGIGDWAQSPIPNPQSPIANPHYIKLSVKFEQNYFYKISKIIQTKIKKWITIHLHQNQNYQIRIFGKDFMPDLQL
jgi:hypothetical protein